jgi:hypothetical protein
VGSAVDPRCGSSQVQASECSIAALDAIGTVRFTDTQLGNCPWAFDEKLPEQLGSELFGFAEVMGC